MTPYRKKLIEVALPLHVISDASGVEKSVPRRGHPQTIHLWWARRPLAAARGVLFAQLVDDPSAWPELFPTEAEQTRERERLFGVLEALVQWDNTGSQAVVESARREIARSYSRSSPSPLAARLRSGEASAADVDAFLGTEVPPIHDPFAGGGTIPLEAQRLGVRVRAGDLNPVALTITKALVEVPLSFKGWAPVNPNDRGVRAIGRGPLEGLADDVAYYSGLVREGAQRTLAREYPEVALPDSGSRATPIAWMWARTVESPNPAFKGCHVPLVSTFWLSNKAGREAWLEPIIDGRAYRFKVQTGKPTDRDAIGLGTKLGRGSNFRCLLSGAPIDGDYIRSEGAAGRLGARVTVVVVEGRKGRLYVAPQNEITLRDLRGPSGWRPDGDVPARLTGGTCHGYGLTKWWQLFLPRQLLTLTTILELISEARKHAEKDAQAAGVHDDGVHLRDGGRGRTAFSEAIGLYLSLGLGRLVDYNSTICTWNVIGGSVRSTFARQAIPMTWDFYETNPLAETTGSWSSCVSWVVDVLRDLRFPGVASVVQADAASADVPERSAIVSTDPPYYDNIAYADLADFFYVWMRQGLRDVYPALFSTLAVPKSDELVAAAHRFGGDRRRAKEFFETRITQAFERLCKCQDPRAPITIFYAFKQSEDDAETDLASSTGWETMLEGLVGTGLVVDGTWPLRTERAARTVGLGSNALASSIVLVCRRRPDYAPSSTRGEFRRLLRKELPDALKKLQQGNIAPVDVAQASIGPGMAIFSRHKEVLEADGKPMTVRAALQLINEVLDEYLTSGEGDFDADTRFAITWYEQHGWEPGPFGDAETLAKARNVSVKGVEVAGICQSAAGKVRILKRHEMRPLDYDPAADATPTVWEFTQHMIRYLDEEGEERAARLLKQLGSRADATRELAYRLFNTCERKKWAEDARAYNGLILAWPELEKLAARMTDEAPAAAPSKPTKKGKKPKMLTKGQQDLFEGDDE
jgi:putative DNA methylase